MRHPLRWKFVVMLALVIGVSAFAWVPPLADRLGVPIPGFLAERRLSLGLDLKGGVQFVLASTLKRRSRSTRPSRATRS